jgi:hypothetical protein
MIMQLETQNVLRSRAVRSIMVLYKSNVGRSISYQIDIYDLAN